MLDNLSLSDLAFNATSVAMMVTDANGTILDVNRSFSAVTGWTRDDIIGQNPRVLTSGRQDPEFYRGMWQSLLMEGVWQGEIWKQRKSGKIYPEQLVINAISDDEGNVTHYVASFTDISKSKAVENQLIHLAYHDFLTGLPNRALFTDRLAQAIALAQRNASIGAVMMIDLDGFKLINDQFGHDIGDQLLQFVAKTLRGSVRDADSVTRFGGDEFAVLLQNVESASAAMKLAQRILGALTQQTELSGEAIGIGASIGIGLFPEQGTRPDSLIQLADQAMYAVKQSGKNGCRIWDQQAGNLSSVA